MKFSDSPVVELAVGGKVLSFEQDNGSMHVGTSVWPCSLVLVKFLDRCLSASASASPSPYSHLLPLPNQRAIELGSGCGPAGMGLSLLGFDIVLTDIAPVMPALKRNIKRNKRILGKAPKYAQLYWNNQAQIRAMGPPFDFVIAADVVYMEDSALQLVDAIQALLAPHGVALLGYQLRSPEAHAVFWEKLRRVFSFVEKVPHEHLHPDYAYEETDVYIIKKQV
ncbi:Protein-lysine methyltransferase METTL21D [Rhynchospora pubera]|uniref:Protein-lysine methyltransferase METTL21D n=1 Tax=Rhynchospora pubera TaxID=906938 RepID=A0AAV8HUU4_9POAL|nr:Protein-lysine methyltransferase METTL21D [Rhynchospora pubera]